MPKPDEQFRRLYGIPANIDGKKTITGQIMFRKSAQVAPDDSGRQLMMVFGVVAVPKDAPIKEHEQYTVSGDLEDNLFQDLQLEVGLNESVKPDCEMEGNSIAGILKSPIWRI